MTLTQKAQAGERGLWPRLQRLQKRYPGRCDDGYFAEGYSEFVTYVLAHRWDQTGGLAKLVRNDRVLLSFVLGHIDATASADNLSVVAKNARERCPKAAPRALCAAISKKAESALSVQ